MFLNTETQFKVSDNSVKRFWHLEDQVKRFWHFVLRGCLSVEQKKTKQTKPNLQSAASALPHMKPPSSVKLMLKNDLQKGGGAIQRKVRGELILIFTNSRPPQPAVHGCIMRSVCSKATTSDVSWSCLSVFCQGKATTCGSGLALEQSDQGYESKQVYKSELNKSEHNKSSRVKPLSRMLYLQPCFSFFFWLMFSQSSFAQEVFAKSMVGIWIGPLQQVLLGFLLSCHYVCLFCEGSPLKL